MPSAKKFLQRSTDLASRPLPSSVRRVSVASGTRKTRKDSRLPSSSGFDS